MTTKGNISKCPDDYSLEKEEARPVNLLRDLLSACRDSDVPCDANQLCFICSDIMIAGIPSSPSLEYIKDSLLKRESADDYYLVREDRYGKRLIPISSKEANRWMRLHIRKNNSDNPNDLFR